MTESLTDFFRFDVEDSGATTTFRLHGELDLSVAPQLRDALAEVDGSTVVVDLSGLAFMDSSGIDALVHAQREIEARGDRLVVSGAEGTPRKVLEICGMRDWLAS